MATVRLRYEDDDDDARATDDCGANLCVTRPGTGLPRAFLSGHGLSVRSKGAIPVVSIRAC